MNLSPQERLIIELLCSISEGKKPEYDTAFIQQVISSGNEWAIAHRYESLRAGSQRPDYVNEVFAILDAYRWISDTINANDIDPSALTGRIKGYAPVRFEGFDGNNESELLSAARTIIDDLDLYGEQKDKANNTHSPRRDAYIKVANAYMRAFKASPNYQLPQTVEQLEAVLNDAARLQLDLVKLNEGWSRGG